MQCPVGALRDDSPDDDHFTINYVDDVPHNMLHSVAVYTCDEGYELTPETEHYARVCLPGGEWSGSAPTCAKKDCEDTGMATFL